MSELALTACLHAVVTVLYTIRPVLLLADQYWTKPVLWRKRRKRKWQLLAHGETVSKERAMWRRAALAALLAVCVFVWIEGAPAIPVSGIETGMRFEAKQKFSTLLHLDTICLETKFCAMAKGTAEYVVIFNPSPKKPFCIALNLLNVFGRLSEQLAYKFRYRVRSSHARTKRNPGNRRYYQEASEVFGN